MNDKTLSELRGVDITSVDKSSLVNVSSSMLDNSVPQKERAEYLLKTIKNPYCFRVGDMGVKVEFSDNDLRLKDLFTDFLIRKKSGL